MKPASVGFAMSPWVATTDGMGASRLQLFRWGGGLGLAATAVLAFVVGSSQCATAQEPAAATTLPAEASSLATVDQPHVLIMSIDGLRPDCLLRAQTPNLRGLMSRGSFSLWAETTDVAITTPSHVSMLTGVVPEKHGINFNGDPPDDARIAVPTLFDLAKAKGLSTGLASGKRKFSIFTLSGHVDFSIISPDPVCKDNLVGGWAAQIIQEHKPRVMFVHFAGADSVGHGKGWGTPEQLQVIGEIDREVGVVLSAYDAAGLTDKLYVIISADHGGTMRTHGKHDVRSRHIPWIAVGPGIREDFDLTRLGKENEVRTYDTFATACALLGLSTPADIDGKPIATMFEGYDLMTSAATTQSVPTTVPASGPTTPDSTTQAAATQPAATQP